jgi:hypothetical protein
MAMNRVLKALFVVLVWGELSSGIPLRWVGNAGKAGFPCERLEEGSGICGKPRDCKQGKRVKGKCRGGSNNVCCVGLIAGDPGGKCKKSEGVCMHPSACNGTPTARKGCHGGRLNKCCIPDGDTANGDPAPGEPGTEKEKSNVQEEGAVTASVEPETNKEEEDGQEESKAADEGTQRDEHDGREERETSDESEDGDRTEEVALEKFHSGGDFESTPEAREGQAEKLLRHSAVDFASKVGHVFMIQIEQKNPESKSEMKKYTKFYTGKTCAFQVRDDGTLKELGGPWISASHAHWNGGGVIPHCKNGFCTKSPHGKPKACKSDSVCNTVGYQSVDGDYRYELARLPPGQYEYRAQYRKNCKSKRNLVVGLKRNVRVSGCWRMKKHKVKTWRDTNHDGKIDEKEALNMYTATGILLHSGYQSKADFDKCCAEMQKRCRRSCKKSGPSSAGCQTVPPPDWEDMTNAVNAATGQRGTFTYVLFYREWTGDQW